MKLTAPKQRQGDYYETLAKGYLEAQGLTFFAKNWHYKNLGELDLVMLELKQKTPCLVIVEVRQRKASQFGTSLDSITPA
ncbi:MAG: YraN family protein, partial [Moraxella osloensis]|nr:YraN family protein [Moraxella osloensis]